MGAKPLFLRPEYVSPSHINSLSITEGQAVHILTLSRTCISLVTRYFPYKAKENSAQDHDEKIYSTILLIVHM